MINYNVLMIDETSQKCDSLISSLQDKFSIELDFNLSIFNIINDDTIAQDLMRPIDIIIIDDDLGDGRWGNDVIENIRMHIDDMPDLAHTPIIYYSAGTDVATLRTKSKNFGNIRCCSFENLDVILFEIARG